MKRHALHKPLASALLASLLLLGCGKEDPAVMLASAKTYLDKQDSKAAIIQLKNALQADPQHAEARYLLGRALLESADPKSAELELRKAKSLNYSDEQVLPLLAEAMLGLGEGKRLIEEMAKVELASADAAAKLQASLGRAYLQQGDVEQADARFMAALKAQPDLLNALIGRAQLLAAKGDLPAALALLDGALGKSPNLPEAWLVKGDILQAQKQDEQALAAYRSAIKAKADFLPAHVALTSRLMDEGKLDEATAALETMRKAAAKSPQTKLMEARLAYQRKQYPAAKEAIDQVLGVAPDNLIALQLAGAIEYELKSYTKAEAHLNKVLSREPNAFVARKALVMSYLRSGQGEKAEATLLPLLDKIDKDSNMLAMAGEVFIRNGEMDKATEYFTKAAALDPSSSTKRTALALTQMAKGESQLAFKELEKAVEVDKGVNANLALIAAHLRRREFDQALPAIAKLEQKQPNSALVHNLRGGALLGKGDRTGARKSFELALAAEPGNFAAASNLAGLDLRDNKAADAKQRFEAMLAKNPNQYRVVLALAELHAKTGGKPAEVAEMISKSVALAPQEPRPRQTLISHYLSQRDNKRALAAAQDALAALPDRPEILDIAGRAQSAAGELNQALSSYTKLAALQPKSPQPYLRMAQAQLAAKNAEAALASLKKAAAISPELLEARHGIVMLDLAAGRSAEALAGARALQKERPKEPVGYVLEGNVHSANKAWSEAEQAYRNGLKQSAAPLLAIRLHGLLASSKPAEAEAFSDAWLKNNPKDSAFPLYLAEAAGKRQDYRTAAAHYRKLLGMHPGDAVLMNNLAWTSAQFNDPQALSYAEKAYQLAPDQPAMMDTLGVLLVEKGEGGRGVSLLRKAVSLAPDAAQVRLNLAKALVKTGQKGEARKELETLAKLGNKLPNQAEVSQLLKSL